jgi:predicted glycoside hydrolase/deacetylase ChbG (UPF0249 family)
MPSSRTNEVLGYPPDARLLILNADDFGMYQAVNEATLRTLTEGVVRSTTVMAPCPWASQAMQLLGDHPDLAFGVHLTVICDLANYKFGPLTPMEEVPSLIDEAGHFYSVERIPEFLALAKLDELEVEFRAQIEAVLSAGLKPTHLDWHCLHSGGRADVFDMTLGLAKEYGLAVRVAERALIARLQGQGLPTDDYDLLDSFRVDTVDKSARYAQMLRDLPVGLSEWAVHPGLATAESQAIDPRGWQVRQTDFDFLMSFEARELMLQEGIIVLNYKPLQEVWRGR